MVRWLAAAGATLGLALAAVPADADCSRTSTGLPPLSDLGTGRFRGFTGGLYPGGHNKPPAEYLKAGEHAAAQVQPLARDGTPSRAGSIVLLSVGMSNVVIEFRALQQLVAADPTRNPRLVLVNGAQGGVDGDSLLKNATATSPRSSSR